MADANEIDEIIRKREELEKKDKLNSEQYATRLEKERENDVKRRAMLFWQFKDYVGREMTETEYQRYLLDFKNVDVDELKKHKKIFNFFEWINQMGLKENGV